MAIQVDPQMTTVPRKRMRVCRVRHSDELVNRRVNAAGAQKL
jgi:hypothetical protein